jgi:hypothetical protein
MLSLCCRALLRMASNFFYVEEDYYLCSFCHLPCVKVIEYKQMDDK